MKLKKIFFFSPMSNYLEEQIELKLDFTAVVGLCESFSHFYIWS